MYVRRTNLQGPHNIPQFQFALFESILVSPMFLFQILDLRVMLHFQFLVCILMRKDEQNVSVKCKNQATYM